jgi:hypothetical protein
MGVSGQRHARAKLCPEEITLDTHYTGGWVGPRADLDTEVRGKILCPCRGSNPDRPVVQFIVRHYTVWATQLLVENLELNIPGSCHGSGGYSPTSHHRGASPCSGQYIWDLWWTEWHWAGLSPISSAFPLSISFHCGPIHICGMYNRPAGGRSSGTLNSIDMNSKNKTKKENSPRGIEAIT